VTDATVAGVDTGLYGVPTDASLEDATQSFDELELVVARIETSAGVEGVGFTYTIGEGGTAIRRFLDDVLVPAIAGESAAPQAARSRLRAETTFVGREGVSELALSAVDIALWDAVGKAAGTPLYALLGGACESVPAYETDGGWLQFDEATLEENAAAAAAAGFSGMKMKVGRGHAEDAARVRAVDEVLPAGMDLLLDANCAYTVPEARRFAARIDDLDVGWLEEPLEKGDYEGHATLRDRIDVPVALGENLYNPTQFKQVLARGAADVLQPDVCRVGGITPWTTVARAATLRETPVSPHYVEPVHVHLAAALDNVPYVEHHSTVLDAVLDAPLEPADGRFLPPDDPGHGVAFDGLDRYEK